LAKIKQAMWVHGTSVQEEREGYFTSKRRKGFGAVFQTTGTQWFHFAIPTPIIFDNKNSLIEKIFVYYRTTMNAKITAIHVYDGVVKIHSIDNLALNGDHSKKITLNHNTWLMNKQHNDHGGLGISVCVDFGDSTPQGVSSITFCSAGADFIIT